MASDNDAKSGRAAASEYFQTLVGDWSGTTTVWFEPEKPVDESPNQGRIVSILDGKGLRWEYTGGMQGKPLQGEALLAYNGQKKQYEMAWMDSFHTGSAVMNFVGTVGDSGLSVLGSYEDPSGGPDWGWRIEFKMSNANQLTVSMYNIFPDGSEAKGVEYALKRK